MDLNCTVYKKKHTDLFKFQNYTYKYKIYSKLHMDLIMNVKFRLTKFHPCCCCIYQLILLCAAIISLFPQPETNLSNMHHDTHIHLDMKIAPGEQMTKQQFLLH